MFSQRTLLHPVLVQTNSLHSNSTDRFSLLTSVGVGMAVIHLYGSILNGGTLCPFVVAGGGLLEMIDWMREQKISVLQSTPSLFRRLAAEPNSEAGFASLRLLKLSGEMVLRSDFDLYRRTCPPDCLLRVGYSTTEAGVVTEDLLDRNSQVLAEQLPAGYPVSDVEIRLCNEVGEPVAEGEGEIVVRSRYVSPGYWRRPDLTQAAFSEDPSGKGRRSFRTGDQGHLLGDGCLVLRGRKDSQVKVRGYRVELSEVEQALLRMKGIQEAAAGTWERNLGEEVLVAYVVAGAQPPPRPAELRSALRQSLPDAMIPSAFVFLESMPLTESGKIDRQALPAPLPAPAHFDGQPPNSLLEAQLCHIWEEVLGVRPVGIQDDFFDLGGTSLQALQLFERIRQQLGQRIPLEVILRASTVEQQAEVLLAPGGTDLPATLVPLQPAGSRPPFFFIHPARGHVLCYRLLAHWLSADQPVYGIQAQGVRPEQKPHTSIEDIAAGHLNSVRNFQPKGPYFLGGYSLGGVIAFEMARQLAAQGEQVALLALLDTPCPARKIRRRTLRQRLQRRAAQLRRRTLRGKAAFLWGLLRRSLPAHLWHLEEVHWAAAQRYRPGPYAGKVLLLRAQGRRDHIDGDPSLGWSEWVTGPLEVAEVPGNHISLLQEPNVRRLAEVLRHHLAETLEKEQGPSGHDRRPAG
jgi:thioesterase domain-containing protein/acyl carrier protein